MKFNVYLGWDEREARNFDICTHSIQKHSGPKITIKSLNQHGLRKKKWYYRPIDEKAATAFSLTRFLIPALEEYKKFSIFIDSDNVITRDIREAFSACDPTKAVTVVKHDYVPKETIKMDGQIQYSYPRKNWSSFIVFNNEHPSNKKLTKELVNSESPSFLHRFSWLKDEEIGELPLEFNFLVGEYPKPQFTPFNLHYTLGSPIFEAYKDGDYSDIWYEYANEFDRLKNPPVGTKMNLLAGKESSGLYKEAGCEECGKRATVARKREKAANKRLKEKRGE